MKLRYDALACDMAAAACCRPGGVVPTLGRDRAGSAGGEVAHGLAGVEAEGQEGEGGRGDAVVDVALDVLAALPRASRARSARRPARRGWRPSAALRSPSFHSRHMRLSCSPRPSHSWNAAYTGHVEVGGDGVAAHGPHGVGVVGRRHEDAGHDLLGSPPPASCTMGATVATSSADSQLMMAPSPSRPASRSMPSRSAATRIGTGCSGTTPSLKPLTENVSYSSRHLLAGERGAQEADHVARALVGLVERDAVPAARRSRSTTCRCRARTGPARPRPASRRSGPGRPGPRVNAGTMAVPRRSDGAHTEASASGVKASAPLASADHTSV